MFMGAQAGLRIEDTLVTFRVTNVIDQSKRIWKGVAQRTFQYPMTGSADTTDLSLIYLCFMGHIDKYSLRLIIENWNTILGTGKKLEVLLSYE